MQMWRLLERRNVTVRGLSGNRQCRILLLVLVRLVRGFAVGMVGFLLGPRGSELSYSDSQGLGFCLSLHGSVPGFL